MDKDSPDVFVGACPHYEMISGIYLWLLQIFLWVYETWSRVTWSNWRESLGTRLCLSGKLSGILAYLFVWFPFSLFCSDRI